MSLVKNPLVSIIVVTYNSSKYVLETLESAKAQTYENIELIISDDCSTDNTVELCNEWLEENGERFINVKLNTSEENTGIPANCNRGVNASNGEWIKLIAGDDKLMINCISSNIGFIMNNQNSYIVFSQVETFDTKRIEIRPKNEPIFHNLVAKKQYRILLLGDVISYTPSVFIRKELFNIVGLFDEEFKLIEDYPFWLKVTRNGFKLDYLGLPTVQYRIHENSVYQKKKNLQNKMIVNVKERLNNLVVRQKYVYPYLSSFKRKTEVYIDYIAHSFCKKKNNRINRLLYVILIKYINPFIIISFVLKRVVKIKNIDFKDSKN